jgi:hypothetical protein
LLIPVLVAGQRHEYLMAFEKNIPFGLGRPVRMPDPGFSPYFSPSAIADYNLKQRVWVIAADSIYRKIFWQYRFTKDSLKKYAPDKNSWYHQWMKEHLRDSLPVIDFEKQELVMYSACGQCLAYCRHDGEDESCHRNACNFMYKWFLRDKKTDVLKETGEKRNFLDALYGYRPDTSYKPVNLSFVNKIVFPDYFEVGQKSSYLYQVSDSVYRKIFDWYIRNADERMPVIDFNREELWVRIACHQCLIICNYLNKYWNNTPCHRNACRYSYRWFVKQKSAGN